LRRKEVDVSVVDGAAGAEVAAGVGTAAAGVGTAAAGVGIGPVGPVITRLVFSTGGVATAIARTGCVVF